MLPKINRLRTARYLNRVQRSRIVFRGPRLALRLVYRRDDLPPRIAVAVGRHVSRRAVDRNRVTRWIKEALRQELSHMSPGFDLRFSATATFTHYSFPHCLEDTHELLKRAGVVHGSERRG